MAKSGKAKKYTTIDINEIQQFDRLANEWWDPSGHFKILHSINPLRIKYILERINKHFDLEPHSPNPLASLNILDVGCGGGLITVPMHKLGANVLGIDASHQNIGVANAFALKHNLPISFKCIPVEKLAKDRKFDVILALEIIEHVENPEFFLQNLVSHLNPKGILIISTINKTIKSFVFGKIFPEYILGWVPIGTHNWNKFISPDTLASIAFKYKLSKIDETGLSLNMPKCQWTLSANKEINYFMSFIKDRT